MGEGAAQTPAPAPSPAQPSKCPACRAPIESFQTRCPSCGSELSSAESGESVKAFFQKLDDLTQKEYEANKAREGSSGKKAKKKQPWPIAMCEAIAVISIIMIILKLTGIVSMLTGSDQVRILVYNSSGYEQDQVVSVYIYDKDKEEIEFYKLEIGNYVEFPLYKNYYLVKVTDGINTNYFYPRNEQPALMSGRVILRYDGDHLMFE